MNDLKLSKLLSYALRHYPEKIGGLSLGVGGWANIDELIISMNTYTKSQVLSIERLLNIVDTDDKQRYELTPDNLYIRACQGHSIAVGIDYPISIPPAILYHGTSEHKIADILQLGILPMSRQYVHLTDDFDTAVKTGFRHGSMAIIIIIKTQQVPIDYRKSTNNVWLIPKLSVDYITQVRIIHK